MIDPLTLGMVLILVTAVVAITAIAIGLAIKRRRTG